MLDRVIDAAGEFIRRKLSRGSGLWQPLSRAFWTCRTFLAFCRNNPWMRWQWARREAEFNRVLGQLSGATDDFFIIQIGACDGVMADPLHDWIKRGNWRGILVEPQAVEFEKLKDTYRDEHDRLIFENVAIADTDGTCTLYRLKDSARTADWERGTASLVVPFNSDRFVAETVKSLTFDTLLRRHGVSHLDLLQIDAEGYDFEILKRIDFGRSSTVDDPIRAPSPQTERQARLQDPPGAVWLSDLGDAVRYGRGVAPPAGPCPMRRRRVHSFLLEVHTEAGRLLERDENGRAALPKLRVTKQHFP